jgi:hypothetical protein
MAHIIMLMMHKLNALKLVHKLIVYGVKTQPTNVKAHVLLALNTISQEFALTYALEA